MLQKLRLPLLIIAASLALPVGAVTASLPGYIQSEHAAVLARWLDANPGYRVADDSDCACGDDLRRLRTQTVGAWHAEPRYHPYYAVGDFNWDGTNDFAVGVIYKTQQSKFRVALFHGPFATHGAKAAYISAPLPLGQALFFEYPRPLPHMLVVGPFESEGAVFRPSVAGYCGSRLNDVMA